MTMSCRITDYKMYNYYEDGEEEIMEERKTLQDITVYDLGGQDFEVYLSKNKEGFMIEMTNEDGTVFEDRAIGDYPAETMASWCRSFLRQYDRLTKGS